MTILATFHYYEPSNRYRFSAKGFIPEWKENFSGSMFEAIERRQEILDLNGGFMPGLDIRGKGEESTIVIVYPKKYGRAPVILKWMN